MDRNSSTAERGEEIDPDVFEWPANNLADFDPEQDSQQLGSNP